MSVSDEPSDPRQCELKQWCGPHSQLGLGRQALCAIHVVVCLVEEVALYCWRASMCSQSQWLVSHQHALPSVCACLSVHVCR